MRKQFNRICVQVAGANVAHRRQLCKCDCVSAIAIVLLLPFFFLSFRLTRVFGSTTAFEVNHIIVGTHWAHNTVHPIKRIDTERADVTAFMCSTQLFGGAPDTPLCIYSTEKMSGLMCYRLQGYTLNFIRFIYVWRRTHTHTIDSTKTTAAAVAVIDPQSTCRFVRMIYVYLLVIKSIDSFVPFCHAHTT